VKTIYDMNIDELTREEIYLRMCIREIRSLKKKRSCVFLPTESTRPKNQEREIG
jgi:hypothetical protein